MTAVQPQPIRGPFNVGDEIRRARLDAHMDQTELAQLLSVSRPLISKWERGKSEPTISQFRLIAEVTSADWLLQKAKYLKRGFALVPAPQGPMELALGVHRPAFDIISVKG